VGGKGGGVLSPPQRLLLVNTRERNWSWSAGERKRERGASAEERGRRRSSIKEQE